MSIIIQLNPSPLMYFKKLFSYSLLFFLGQSAFSQNLPLNFKVLNEYLRREQVKGSLNNDFSFNVRPIYPEKAFPEFNDSFLIDSLDGYSQIIKPLKNKNEKIEVSPLPLQLISVYNSTSPAGWANGELIPAKGIQTLISAGAHVKVGKLSIQLYPQFHYAQNSPFEEYPTDAPEEYFRYLRRSVYYIDNPVRFGTSSISNFSFGNSHVMLNLGGVSFGVSSENIWSGPGQFNSLVISDNAPGFNHFRIQSTHPLKTFLGSFEGNYWIGELKGSGLPHFSDATYTTLLDGEKEDDWRYFTGITFSYSPKWTPGFSLGFTRGFQIYRGDMENNFKAFFPLFAPLQKENEGLIESRDLRQDQNVSVFSRWSIPNAKTEIYFEYSRNDHPFNFRDLLLNIEHSRAYQIGFSKYIKLPNKYSLGIQGEITQTQASINNIIRWPNYLGSSNSGLGSYDNFQVRHGWTNKGQVLGSNTGISGNSQLIKVGIYSGINEISIIAERLERHPNFYQLSNTASLNVNKWVSNSIFLNYTNTFNNLMLKSSLGFNEDFNRNFFSKKSKIDDIKTNLKSFILNLNIQLIYHL